VVVAVPDFEPAVGGTVRHAGGIARALLRRGADVVLVTRRRTGSDRDEVRDGLRVVRVGPRRTGALGEALGLVSLAWWLRRRRSDIALLQTLMWPDAQAAAALAGLLPRTVVMWAIRGEVTQALQERAGPGRSLVVRARRRQLARCTHVALTPLMLKELEAAGLGANSVVVPVPVDTDAFRPAGPSERKEARARLQLPSTAFVAVYVGHLEKRKGIDRLVDALASLRARTTDARLLLVGAGREGPNDTEPAVRERVRELGLDDAVRFCGAQADPRPFLHAADVLVLPSFREGMPNTLLEAMACGLPCVAPASAGGDEVLDPTTGLVPASNEPEELAAALAELAADPERRAAMGRAAVERARAFDVDVVVDRLVELYARNDGRARSA
jgi:glycosyltransferase involved in cell wall biosynthesis